MKYLARAGRTENELAGAEDGAGLILALLMKPTVADTDYAQVDYTWGQLSAQDVKSLRFPHHSTFPESFGAARPSH